ncbi:unnamed protein product [Adineta steineri]|uniref:Cytochrome P450 n=1 Tax=Adineta steineri TaxID=433720 RepID=A0A814XUI4_9BILA|nr:unnamed protein product [Adineta steineri]
MIFICIGVIIIIWLLIKILDTTDVPKIYGLSEASGWPIFGSLFELGENHPVALSNMAKKLGAVFQIRMGNKRVIVANSYDSAKALWIDNQYSLISRPVLHTFHTVLSRSDAYTIGSSPWDESCKRRRQAVAAFLNKSSIQSYMPIVDTESVSVIDEILRECRDGLIDLDFFPHIQRFALNTTLMFTYGTRLSSSFDELLKEIVEVQAAISRFRSTSDNWQDYVPLLCLFPSKSTDAKSYRLRRDRYIETLLVDLKQNIARATDKPCIIGSILKDPSTKLNDIEIKSICLSMIGGSLDTAPPTIIFGIGYLSSAHGQEIQQRAYEEIHDVYPDGDAWEKCLVEERIPYVTALCKEILRYFTVSPMSLPRRSINDIHYNGAIIPAGTSFYMNAFAANYDEKYFKDPHAFNPERYLDEMNGIPHYAYGAGSRMCMGTHLANRELFVVFTRLILAFQIVEPINKEDAAIVDAMEANKCPASTAAQPKPFKCRFKPRNREMLNFWLENSRKQIDDS